MSQKRFKIETWLLRIASTTTTAFSFRDHLLGQLVSIGFSSMYLGGLVEWGVSGLDVHP